MFRTFSVPVSSQQSLKFQILTVLNANAAVHEMIRLRCFTLFLCWSFHWTFLHQTPRVSPPLVRRHSRARSYELLQLQRGSSKEDIRKRYRELVATEHPDKRPDRADADERFAQITAAYQELMETPEYMDFPEVEEFGDEKDNDSLVVLLFIVFWIVIFAALAVGQDSLSWEACGRNWEWWCYLKGN